MRPGAIVTVFLALLACVSGCRQEMFNQPRTKPLRESKFFNDGGSSRPLPPHTVARGHLDDDEAFNTGAYQGRLLTVFPMKVTRATLDRGRERFNIYCAVCHGRDGDGQGIVVQRGFPAPPSYHIDRLRNAPVGHFFDVMTRGYGVMYSYANRVDPADRWAIAAYIRALQLSRHATIDDVPAADRKQLEEAAP